MAACLLAGCAVGPDFQAPAAPTDHGLCPARGIAPRRDRGHPSRVGRSSAFVDGLDIPGQWWTLFQSAELNALIERATREQPNAQAAAGGIASGERTFEAQPRRATIRACRATSGVSAKRFPAPPSGSQAGRSSIQPEQRQRQRLIHHRMHSAACGARSRRSVRRRNTNNSRSRRAT